MDDHEFVRFKEAALDDIDEVHQNIYGTPCTAQGQTDGK